MSAGILCAEVDRPVGERIAASLGALDVVLSDARAAAKAELTMVVVVVSSAATRDPEWRRTLAGLGKSRPIPVVIAGTPKGDVPHPLSELSWIEWPQPGSDQGGAAAAASVAIFTALNSDLDRLRQHRDLATETESWIAAGREKKLLIDDYRRAKRAAKHLRESHADALTRPTAEMEEFVRDSMPVARKQRRKRRWRYARRGIALVFVALAFITIVQARKAEIATQRLAVSISGYWRLDGRPDRAAMVSAATMLRGDQATYSLASIALRESLGQPWSKGILGTLGPGGLGDSVPIREGTEVLSVDAFGALTLWNSDSAAALWRRDLGLTGEPPLLGPLIAADEDGRLAAVAYEHQLVIVHTSPWRLDRVELPVAATRLAIGRRVVVGGGGRLISVAPNPGGEVRQAGTFRQVLDLIGDGAEVPALVETEAGELNVVDGASGRRLSSLPAPPWHPSEASLGPGGHTIAVGATDGRLAATLDGRRWEAAGQQNTPGSVLQVLPGDLLAFGGWGTPVRLLDLRSQVPLGPICTTIVAVQTIHAIASGGLLTCTNGWVSELWSTADQAPLHDRPSVLAASDQPRLRRAGLHIQGTPGGDLRVIDSAEQERSELPVGGRVTAVALAPNHHSILAGTALGEVVEFDLLGSSLIKTVSWRSPDGAPIRTVGWLSGGRLAVGTASGLWWRPRSCDFCGSDRVAVEHARRRFWGCYEAEALAFMGEEVERRLGLRQCSPPPEASQ